MLFRNREKPRFVFWPDIEPSSDILSQNFMCGISNFNCGATIKEVVKNSRSLDFEVATLFDRRMRRFYCSTIYECSCGTINIPKAWFPHVQLFVHNHPNSNEGFSPADFKAIYTFGCPSALLICQDFLFLLEGLPRNWRSTKVPAKLKTPQAFGEFIDSHFRTSDPFALDSIAVDLVMNLRCAGIRATYSTLDFHGNTIMVAPGYYTTDEMFAYNNRLLRARGLPTYR